MLGGGSGCRVDVVVAAHRLPGKGGERQSVDCAAGFPSEAPLAGEARLRDG